MEHLGSWSETSQIHGTPTMEHQSVKFHLFFHIWKMDFMFLYQSTRNRVSKALQLFTIILDGIISLSMVVTELSVYNFAGKLILALFLSNG